MTIRHGENVTTVTKLSYIHFMSCFKLGFELLFGT